MKGVIYTFYSYKGGVGRSMALANIAVHFHAQGYRTLLIDMDLEAPGLEKYFEENSAFDTSGISTRGGFCDYIQAYLKRASAHTDDPSDALYPRLDDYLTQIGVDRANPLLFMHAGRRWGDTWPEYVHFIQDFDWADFYERWEGGACLDWFGSELRKRAEIVLIDSRTGVTEMGGVATQHLADAVIVMFGSNLQNVDNSAQMTRSFLSGPVQTARGGRTLSVMAVPSRVDDQDSRGFSEFQKRSTEAFSNIAGCGVADGYGMDQMCVPYLAPFSYREQILSGDHETETSARRILEAYGRIAANMQRLAPRGTALREGTPSSKQLNLQVALLAASQDEALAKELSSYLTQDGIECALLGQRGGVEKDVTAQLGGIACAVAIVTPAFGESALTRGLLQALTDLAKPIIPAVFTPVPTMPLLLVDKQYVDCQGGALAAAPRIAKAVRAARAPAKPEAAGRGSVYLSYARQDSYIAHDVFNYLTSRGFSVWFDQQRIAPGSFIQLEIERAMEGADVMVALLSPASTQSAEVRGEWTFFGTTLKKPIVPVLTGETQLPYLFARTQPIDLTRTRPQAELGEGSNALAQLVEVIRTRLEQPQSEPREFQVLARASREQEDKNQNSWLKFSPKPPPLKDDEQWHVFLSYRSTDRSWVLNLYDILHQQGFEVFMDQYVLRPGMALVPTLQTALRKSQSAVLVWSTDNEWSRREYEVLDTLATNKKGFGFVPVCLRNSTLPIYAGNRVFLDFSSYPDGPNGGELLRLLHAIVGRPLSEEAAHFATEQDAVAQQAANEIAAAIRNRDPELLVELFQAGGLAWRTSATLGCKAAEGLVRLARNDEAIEILAGLEKEFPRAVRPRQLRALALARRGRTDDLRQAQRIVGALYEAGERDPETLGIYGRTWMDRYARSNDPSDLRQSRDLYAEAFERAPDDYYTGVNAAATSLFLGTAEDIALAEYYAGQVQNLVGTEPRPGDYWMTATVAEVSLIRRNYSGAARLYKAAVAMASSEIGSHQSTWTQACRLLAKLNPTPEERALVRSAFAHLPDCEKFGDEPSRPAVVKPRFKT